MTAQSYVYDTDKWIRHFVNMPTRNGMYLVGAVHQYGGKTTEPVIQMITPVAAAVERAKSQEGTGTGSISTLSEAKAGTGRLSIQ